LNGLVSIAKIIIFNDILAKYAAFFISYPLIINFIFLLRNISQLRMESAS